MINTLDEHAAAYQGNSLYDFDNEILLTWYPERVLHHVGTARSLLELGLGHGFTAAIFSPHFERHVVLEGSPAIIRNFQAKHPGCRAEIVETYFEAFATGELFDVIVMGFILEHVDDPLIVLNRFRKFLAPGGKMFLAVPNAEALNRRLGHYAGLLEDMGILSENDISQGHKRYYTVDSLRDQVSKAGYQINWMEGLYLKPLTTSQIVSLRLDRKILNALCHVGIEYPELCCGLLVEISAQ